MARLARSSPLFAVPFLCGALGLAATAAAPPCAAASANPAATALHELLQTEWQREMREDPLKASADGFHQYDGFWPDVSLATLAREHEEDIAALQKLAAIDRG